MISFIVQYKNGIRERKKITLDFLEMMDDHIKNNPKCESVLSDYDSNDGIKEILESYKTSYIKTKPTFGQYFNTGKCLNNATWNAKNEIIAPLALDIRFKQETINLTKNLFRALGDIVVRLICRKLNKAGGIGQVTFAPYILKRDHVLKARGWDERIHGWGKEDDDLIDRILLFQDVIEIKVRAREIGYIHLWHEPSPVKTKHSISLANPNVKYYVENMKTNGANLINSYW